MDLYPVIIDLCFVKSGMAFFMRNSPAFLFILQPLDEELAFPSSFRIVIIPSIQKGDQTPGRYIRKAVMIMILLPWIETIMTHNGRVEHGADIRSREYVHFRTISFIEKSIQQKLLFVERFFQFNIDLAGHAFIALQHRS